MPVKTQTELLHIWPRAKEILLPSIETTLGTHTADDIFEGIVRGKFQLWMGNRSAGVTELVYYPQCRAIRIFLSGGDFEEMKYMGTVVEKAAIEAGIDRIEIGGRRGFLRALDGYKELCTYMVKDLA